VGPPPARSDAAPARGVRAPGGGRHARAQPITLNPFIEILAEAFFVTMVSLFGLSSAGVGPDASAALGRAAARGDARRGAVAARRADALGGRRLLGVLASRPLVRGYVLVTFSAALIGTLFALGAWLGCSTDGRQIGGITRQPRRSSPIASTR
jgi:hypothetical protein